MRNTFVRPALFLLALTSALTMSACREAESTAAAAATATAEHRVDVPALTVGVTDLESTLQISGSLGPETRVGIVAKLPGSLSQVNVHLGDRVRAGQVIATLDRREIDAQVDAAEAAVNVARAALESTDAALANAELERDRAQNLFDKGAIPKQRLDAAVTAGRASTAQRALAAANVAQAEASLRRAHEVQRDATMTAPTDGVVVERNFDPGSVVGTGDKPVVVIADLRVMKLEAGVSELEAGRLTVGMPVHVNVQARPGEMFEGRLAAIAPEVDPRNRHFAIEVRIANPGTLLAGMYASASVPVARVAGVLAIPPDAITTRGGRRVVLKIDNATVQEAPVTEGLSSGSLVQISAGLKAGDTIVADARRDVAPGTRVNPVFAR
jgi:RND family efflux transporter MFP subunit